MSGTEPAGGGGGGGSLGTGQSPYDDNELIALIQFHSIDIIIGGISSFICALTLLVFFSTKQFFLQNKLLTLLAIGDLFTSFGVLALGLMRKGLYTDVMETSRVPLETSWTCAGKPFVYLRLLGALIPPGIVLWISVERFLAVYWTQLYRRHIMRHSNIPPLAIILYTLLALSIAYGIAWNNRKKGNVEAYCGRKNAFTKRYTTYVYVADVLGFAVALLINCVTLCRLGRLYAQRQNRFEVKKQLRRINYLIVISIISTLTVAIPNGISLISAWIGRLNIALSDPANWMVAAKCSVNLFIYLLLKADFRQRVYEILGCLNVDHLDNKDRANDASGATGAIGAGGGAAAAGIQPQNSINIDKDTDNRNNNHNYDDNNDKQQQSSESESPKPQANSRRLADARNSITELGEFGRSMIGIQRPKKSLVLPTTSRSEQHRRQRESVRHAWTTHSQMRIDRTA